MAQAWLKRRHQDRVLGPQFFAALNGRLAIPWTWVFLRLGLSPNQVSLLALAVSVAGAWLIAFAPAGRLSAPAGALALMLGIWWDHSDGQVARASGKGSLRGALFDTVLDRWVETLWLLALALAPAMGGAPRGADPRALWWMAVAAWAVHANLYLRWVGVQSDLYNLRKELLQAKAAQPALVFPHPAATRGVPRTFFVPLAPSRDLSFWALAAVTVSGFWFEGLVAVSAFHTAVGLERTYYAIRDAGRPGTQFLRAFLDPDYHR